MKAAVDARLDGNAFTFCRGYWDISIGTHLFVKVPRPGNSDVTFSFFESSLSPVTTSLTTQR